VSRKSERLVNLTIALLATKRYLTKSEIFATVAGYEGEAESKDRMFERDKDDLRSLGIAIELGTFDPLFEDEAGYRIKPESYALQLSDIDPLGIALLSQAAQLWREAALGESAISGLRKLKGLGLEPDMDSVKEITSIQNLAPEQLAEIIEAVSERRQISFEYLNEELKDELRKIAPYRLSNSRGYWYLIGLDEDRQALRTFRVDRISSAISFTSKPGSFEVDISALDEEDLKSEDFEVARIAIRKGIAPHLRAAGAVTEIDSEWDSVELTYHSENYILQEVLWLGSNAQVLEPETLRAQAIKRLEMAIAHYG
jgi:proteasome accessory factor B